MVLGAGALNSGPQLLAWFVHFVFIGQCFWPFLWQVVGLFLARVSNVVTAACSMQIHGACVSLVGFSLLEWRMYHLNTHSMRSAADGFTWCKNMHWGIGQLLERARLCRTPPACLKDCGGRVWTSAGGVGGFPDTQAVRLGSPSFAKCRMIERHKEDILNCMTPQLRPCPPPRHYHVTNNAVLPQELASTPSLPCMRADPTTATATLAHHPTEPPEQARLTAMQQNAVCGWCCTNA